MEHSQLIKNMTSVAYALGIALLGVSINSTPIVATPNSLDSGYFEDYKDYSNASIMIYSNNYYTNYYHNGFKSIEKEAFDLFGSMRDATNNERASVSRYIKGISVNTGVNFFDLC